VDVGVKQQTYVMSARQDLDVQKEISPPMGKEDYGHAMATDNVSQTLNQRDGKGPGSYMNGSLQGCQMVSGMVRRLTPTECERLQGFPDDHTRIAWRGKAAENCPDGPRYRAIGNSMAVNVMEWIGERIQMVEDIINDS
jgi:DNA (cytosine-5)-methyltransferase 1